MQGRARLDDGLSRDYAGFLERDRERRDTAGLVSQTILEEDDDDSDDCF
jgi:hypothetical protein